MGYTMTYQQYIAYHKGGDAGVEERMIASLARHYCLKPWDAFRLIYYYSWEGWGRQLNIHI